MTYAEKLKDPRWQKKRLEIMQRDKFTCIWCFRNDATLNVDHKIYRPRLNPWDYTNDDLQTLCENCHKKLSERRQKIADQIGRMDEADLSELEIFLNDSLLKKSLQASVLQQFPGATKESQGNTIVDIYFECDRINNNDLSDLRDILLDHPGHSPVRFHLLNTKTEVIMELPEQVFVSFSKNLEQQIDQRFGDNIAVAN